MANASSLGRVENMYLLGGRGHTCRVQSLTADAVSYKMLCFIFTKKAPRRRTYMTCEHLRKLNFIIRTRSGLSNIGCPRLVGTPDRQDYLSAAAGADHGTHSGIPLSNCGTKVLVRTRLRNGGLVSGRKHKIRFRARGILLGWGTREY